MPRVVGVFGEEGVVTDTVPSVPMLMELVFVGMVICGWST